MRQESYIILLSFSIIGDQTSSLENKHLISTYCPFINGIYSFKYARTTRNMDRMYPDHLTRSGKNGQHVQGKNSVFCGETDLNNPKSSISNCPKGHVINITFQNDICNSEQTNIINRRNLSFVCLGDWPAKTKGERYVALLQNARSFQGQTQYRCAVST